MNLPKAPQSKMNQLAKSLRPHMALSSWVLFAAVVVDQQGFDLLLLLLGLILLIALYGMVVIINDLADYPIDTLNKRRDIPLVAGTVAPSDYVSLLVGLSVVVTLIGLALNQNVLLVSALYLLLGWLYSGPANLKNRGLPAIILLGACYGLLPWWLGAAATGIGPNPTLLVVSISSFIFAAGTVLLKDFKDVVGDRAGGKRTLLVVFGSTFVQGLLLALTLTGYGLLITYKFYQGAIMTGFVGAVLALLSGIILANSQLTRSAAYRRKYGNLVRVGFYLYAITLYSIS
ncbi:hypothetical protein CYG49_04755 [Candidatus Saccharibacteria bacterium]|nr:MAG: hypothetical protein CYG49_04755 [Candidatus Saccharibacteria bacterium]